MSEKFITIGSTSIRKSNIKAFGIGTSKSEDSFLFGIIKLINNDRYLYVTTYQGDNYQFEDGEVNIKEVLEELENI